MIMSLRHGPVPPGRRMFEVSAEETIALAQPLRLRCALNQKAEPSLRQPGVSWTRLAFRKEPSNANPTRPGAGAVSLLWITMNLRAADPEGQPWVERGGPGVLVRMAAVGASSSLPPIPAKVASPSRQRPLRLGDGNRSSCPIAAVRLREQNLG
jgi:hypothetical protein